MLEKYKRLIWMVGILVALVIGLVVYKNLQFHITGTTPDHRNYPASIGTMEVNFNEELDKADLEERISSDVGGVVDIDFEGTVKVTVSDKKLTLRFSKTPLPGSYEIILSSITSADGDTLTKTLPFIVKDIPYDKLSDKEKALFDSLAAGSGEEEHLLKYPILARLPYDAEKYRIGYRFEESDPAPTLLITMRFFAPGNNADPATPEEQQAYLNDIRKYRNEALDWLKAQSPTVLEEYTVDYTESELKAEFPSGRGNYFDGPADVEPDHPE